MQREIEIKVLDIVPEELEQELIELGAEKIVEEKQVNYTFAPKNAEDFDTGYLRIRETYIEGKRESIELTFKEMKNSEDVRINNEFTTKIDSVTMMTQILDRIGVKIKYKGEKQRISYRYKGQRLSLIHI